MEYSRRYVEPDVEVVSARKKSKKRGRGGVAVTAHQTAEPVVVMVESVEHGPFEESYLEIRRRREKKSGSSPRSKSSVCPTSRRGIPVANSI